MSSKDKSELRQLAQKVLIKIIAMQAECKALRLQAELLINK
ncbi:hypothetical protein [Pedobacter cryoconitis]|nr:hypothetical protein [Pedobacter cryoconitis]